VSAASAVALPLVGRHATARRAVSAAGRPRGRTVVVRTATETDAEAIHALVVSHLADGHLLPRERDEIARHAHRFVVAMRDGDVVACADLAPLSSTVAEVRSLVVDHRARGTGVGGRLIEDLLCRATHAGYERLCAFTHAPAYFVQHGFSIVPHVWLPDKIVTDCHACPHFRACGQYALVRALGLARRADVPLTSLHA